MRALLLVNLIIYLCYFNVAFGVTHTTATWTWMSGVNTINELGKYPPELGPGGRSGSAWWFDHSAQELWLFGGDGMDANNNWGTFFPPFVSS